jgi:hypothetical protein
MKPELVGERKLYFLSHMKRGNGSAVDGNDKMLCIAARTARTIQNSYKPTSPSGSGGICRIEVGK